MSKSRGNHPNGAYYNYLDDLDNKWFLYARNDKPRGIEAEEKEKTNQYFKLVVDGWEKRTRANVWFNYAYNLSSIVTSPNLNNLDESVRSWAIEKAIAYVNKDISPSM